MSTVERTTVDLWLESRRRVAIATDSITILSWATVHAVLFLWVFKLPAFFYRTGSDTHHVYWPVAHRLLSGDIPYVDPHFFVEYPPLATIFFVLPALFGARTFTVFDWLFAAQMVVVDGVLLVVLARLGRRLYGAQADVPVAVTLTVYGVAIALLGELVAQRFDLLPAALMTGAILALCDGRSRLAWILLLLATAVKIYPIVLAPLFLLYDLRRGRRAGAILFVAGLAFYVTAWYLFARWSLGHFAWWEGGRGIESETSFASIIYIVRGVGLQTYHTMRFGSSDLVSRVSHPLVVVSDILTIVVLVAVYVSYARRRGSGTHEMEALVTYSLLAVLGSLLCGKLLSAQFMIWLVPLLAVQPRRRLVVGLLTIAMVGMSHWIYPSHWMDLLRYHRSATLVLLVRNGVLGGLFVLVWRSRLSALALALAP